METEIDDWPQYQKRYEGFDVALEECMAPIIVHNVLGVRRLVGTQGVYIASSPHNPSSLNPVREAAESRQGSPSDQDGGIDGSLLRRIE